jgi:hypothetical protein
MTRDEVKEVVKILGVFYGNTLKIDPVNIKSFVDSWHWILKDYDKAVVMKNLKSHVETNKFPPSVAELIKKSDSVITYPPLRLEDLD